MNSLDLVLLCLAVLAAWRGWSRGALLQTFSWGGLLLGLVAGTLMAPLVATLMAGTSVQIGVALGTVIAGVVLGSLGGRLIGKRLRAAAHRGVLKPIDRVLGATISVLAIAFVVWFIAFNLVSGPFPALATEIQDSRVVQGLDAAFPEPPTMLAQLRVVLDDVGFPQVFSGVPPEPSGPVKDPTDDQAALAFAAGEDATVRVATSACGDDREGSGFVADDQTVVTNAHVLAGGRERIRVVSPDGTTNTGVVLSYDPALDIAILYVPDLDISPLPLAEEAVERGAVGAVTGYPDAGALTGTKAAVRHALEASGRDIYGDAMVVRPILELQTDIHPGNSGGPFMLEDGTVGGVVFAASTTDVGIGYAIQVEPVRDLLGEAAGTSDVVETGRCVE